MRDVKVAWKGQTKYNLSRGELLMKLIFITLSGEYRVQTAYKLKDHNSVCTPHCSQDSLHGLS